MKKWSKVIAIGLCASMIGTAAIAEVENVDAVTQPTQPAQTQQVQGSQNQQTQPAMPGQQEQGSQNQQTPPAIPSIVPLLQGNPAGQQETLLPSDSPPVLNPVSPVPFSSDSAPTADSTEPKHPDSQQGAAAPETAAKEEAILAQAFPPEAQPRLKEEARPAPISASPEEERMEQTVPEHLPGAGGEQNMNRAPSTQDMQGGQASQACPPSPTQP